MHFLGRPTVRTVITHALRKAAIRKREAHSWTTSCWVARHRTRLRVGTVAWTRACGPAGERHPQIPNSALSKMLGRTQTTGSRTTHDCDPGTGVPEGPSASSFHCPASHRTLASFRPTCPPKGTQSQVDLLPRSQTLVFSGNLSVPTTSTCLGFFSQVQGLPRRGKISDNPVA